jgi:hypothetical protein
MLRAAVRVCPGHSVTPCFTTSTYSSSSSSGAFSLHCFFLYSIQWCLCVSVSTTEISLPGDRCKATSGIVAPHLFRHVSRHPYKGHNLCTPNERVILLKVSPNCCRVRASPPTLSNSLCLSSYWGPNMKVSPHLSRHLNKIYPTPY